MIAPQNGADIFAAYEHYLLTEGRTNDLAMTQTALVRYMIPGWGGVGPKGARATIAEVQAGLEFLNRISVQKFSDALFVQEQVFEQLGVSKQQSRGPRCYVKKMIDWASSQGWFDDQSNNDESAPYRFRYPNGQRRISARDLKLSGRTKRSPFLLKDHETNASLGKELKAFKGFLQKHSGNKEESSNKHLRHVKQMLGWLYRFKGVSIDKLSLELIIPIVHLNLQLRNFKNTEGLLDMNAYSIAKQIAQEEAKEAAAKALQLAEEYLDFYAGSPTTRSIVLDALIGLAKFIYLDETDHENIKSFDDIPTIVRLRKLRCQIGKEIKFTPECIPFEQKSIPWEQAIEVLICLQKEADSLVYNVKDEACKSGHSTRSRAETSIASSLQRFLILAFMTLIPPDRSRTIRELEVGRTLKQGSYESGVFVPIKRMQNPLKAEWYLYLTAMDYKTGKHYGTYQGKLLDIPLGNKSFYQYINDWLTKYRAVLKPKHNFFFTGKDGQPLNTSSKLLGVVKGAFVKFTGVPVTPKELRRMYVTYLMDSGASEAELEGAACAMHHSRRMQSLIYDKQTQLRKVAPTNQFNQRTIKKILGNSKSSRINFGRQG